MNELEKLVGNLPEEVKKAVGKKEIEEKANTIRSTAQRALVDRMDILFKIVDCETTPDGIRIKALELLAKISAAIGTVPQTEEQRTQFVFNIGPEKKKEMKVIDAS